MTARTFSALALALLAAPVAAAPTLGPAYGASMVLQRGEPIKLAGQGRPNEQITATLGDQHGSAQADAQGDFVITLPAQRASTAPLRLTLRDSSGTSRYADILIGDVFLCSGQSNMELPVARALDVDNQLRQAADDGIRLLKVPKTTAPVPQAAFAERIGWRAATSASVADFSAACFYMAKALRRQDADVPVGLIHANWGGSAARAWLTPQGVETLFGTEALALLNRYAADPFAATQTFVPQWFDWWRSQDDGREPWRDSAALDWRPIPQFSVWNEWKGSGLDTQPQANVWLRQTIHLSKQQAAGDAVLSIGAIDDLDLTFVNGRPVGYSFGWGVERHYHVPRAYLREGANEILIAANNMWDTGGFFAGPDRLFLTPGAGDVVPLGADWDYATTKVTAIPPRAPWDANAGMGVMHNAMIAPLGPMRVAGIAWYQGEADVGQPGYAHRLRTLFAGWRRQFGDQARMLVVQLADYGTRQIRPVASGWAELRQQQVNAVQADGNAALVTAIDIGEPADIHPANKNDLGKRLALAFAGAAMPMPTVATRADDRITIRFTGVVGDLVAQGGPYPLGVELCGAAQDSCRFVVPQLAGDRMIIPLTGDEPALRVRHAWSDAPIVNLFDQRGMPVPGFELAVTP